MSLMWSDLDTGSFRGAGTGTATCQVKLVGPASERIGNVRRVGPSLGQLRYLWDQCNIDAASEIRSLPHKLFELVIPPR